VPGLHLCNLVVGGKTPLLPRERLAEMGYAVVLYANLALQASMLAMQQSLAHLHATGSVEGIEDRLIGFRERQELVDADHYNTLSRRYGAQET